MEFKTYFLFEKDLFGILENNIINIFDISNRIFIQNYSISNKVIKGFLLNQLNENTIVLLINDNEGNVYVYDLTRKKLLNEIKVDDTFILQIRTKKFSENVYCLLRNGKIKVHNILNGNLVNIIQPNKQSNTNKKYKFDIDNNEKKIIFAENNVLSLFDIKTNTNIKEISKYSSNFEEIEFSNDSKIFLSLHKGENFCQIWSKKTNKPLFSLSNDFIPLKAYLIKKENKLYHCFCINKTKINIFSLNFNEITIGDYVKPNSKIELNSAALLDVYPIFKQNSGSSLYILQGDPINLDCQVIEYIKGSNGKFIENISINGLSKRNKLNQLNQKKEQIKIKPHIVNDVEMSDRTVTFDALSTDIEHRENKKLIKESKSDKVTLANLIKDSLINNDNQNFEWALSQDKTVITETVKLFDIDMILMFLSKTIEGLQAANKKNYVPWISLILKRITEEFEEIPDYLTKTLKIIQTLIQRRTFLVSKVKQSQQKFKELKTKYEKVNKNLKKSSEKKTGIVPRLDYYESDSDEETKTKLEQKLNKSNIKKTTLNKVFKEKEKTNKSINEDLLNQFANDEDEDFEDLDEEMENEDIKRDLDNNDDQDNYDEYDNMSIDEEGEIYSEDI